MARAQKDARREIKEKMKLAQPSEPQMTTSVQNVSPDYPSVFEPASELQPSSQAAPLLKEPVVDPITVSASGPMPSEPSQP